MKRARGVLIVVTAVAMFAAARAQQRSGRVVADDTGAPLANVRIEADGSGERGSLRSDTDGRFALPPANGAAPAIRLSKAGFVTRSATADDISEIRLARGAAISGHVRDDFGTPLPFMHTDPDLASLADNPTARADIRDDWTFEMTGLNGPRRLTLARAPADWMLDGMTLDGVDVADSALPFGTDARSLSNVEVRMTRRLTELSGTIARTDKSPSTTGVVAFAIDRSAWFVGSRRVAFARPDADGVFSMSKLPPGSYEVAAFDEEDVPDPSTAEDASELLRTLQPRATPVNIAPGQHQIITVPPPPR